MNIIIDNSCNILDYQYENILKQGLGEIEKVLTTDFPQNIKWILYDANIKFRKSQSALEKVIYPREGYEYGYYRPAQREIWISTLTVKAYERAKCQTSLKSTVLPQMKPQQPNLFIDVIIDEITHAITGENHGCNIYEHKYQELLMRCIELW